MNSKDDLAHWNVAGLSVESTFTPGVWLVPAHVKLDGELLRWSWQKRKELPSHVRPRETLLFDFVARIDSPQRVEEFAGKWGVLGICEHGLPASHYPGPTGWRRGDPIPCCQPLGYLESKLRRGFEPVETWIRFANEFKGALNLAGMIESASRGEKKKFNGVGVVHFDEEWLCLTEDEAKNLPLQTQRIILTIKLNRLLLLGRVHPHFVCAAEPTPEIRFQGSPPWGLFGALVTQLMFAVTKVGSITFCSECAKPYMPSRRARADQRRYCPCCRDTGAPQRYASMKYRTSKVRSTAVRSDSAQKPEDRED